MSPLTIHEPAWKIRDNAVTTVSPFLSFSLYRLFLGDGENERKKRERELTQIRRLRRRRVSFLSGDQAGCSIRYDRPIIVNIVYDDECVNLLSHGRWETRLSRRLKKDSHISRLNWFASNWRLRVRRKSRERVGTYVTRSSNYIFPLLD